MGPGIGFRDKFPNTGPKPTGCVSLQWGPELGSGISDYRVALATECYQPLQWGPELGSGIRRRFRQDNVPLCPASMGPGIGFRDKSASVSSPRHLKRTASMGPGIGFRDKVNRCSFSCVNGTMAASMGPGIGFRDKSPSGPCY